MAKPSVWDKISGQYINPLTGKPSPVSASEKAAQITASGQEDALNYMKEVEAPVLDIRNQFLPQYADIMQGGQAQQDLINSAQQSPLYQSIMGGQQVGEDAIMRNAGMTGGLRSGNVSADLTDYGSQLSNQALLQSYNQQLQGIQGLANIPLNTNNIANATAAPSTTLGQGMIANEQNLQQQKQNRQSNMFGLAGMGLLALSDVRLKTNIKQIGRKNGFNLYSWDWNKQAEEFGLTGEGQGVMAHEVAETNPEFIQEINGFIAVDYAAIGLIEEAA